jgi:uncharacterized protein (DUF2147 family)
MGYETYPARWKTHDKEIEIMQPAADKTCVLNVAMKEHVAYNSENGQVQLKSAAEFKQWMDNNQYDPEHGKDLPVKPAGGAQ